MATYRDLNDGDLLTGANIIGSQCQVCRLLTLIISVQDKLQRSHFPKLDCNYGIAVLNTKQINRH